MLSERIGKMKNKRQNEIIKIVTTMPVHTHEALIAALTKAGYNVTQATVSRDIKDLGLIKVPSSDGSSIYSLPEKTQGIKSSHINMVSDSVRKVSSALHTIVINTYPGMASAVAAAIDASLHTEILGSVAGDDTVLIITQSPDAAEKLEGKIKTMFKSE